MNILSFLTIPNCVLLTVTILFLYILAKRPYSFFKNINIPGPEPCIILGNILQLTRKGMAAFDYEMKQKYGNVTGHYIGHRPIIVISDPEMVKEICIKQFSSFTNRYDVFPKDEISDKFISLLKDSHWKFVRTILLPTFSTSHLKHMIEIMNNAAGNLEENFSSFADSGKDVEMKQVYSNYTLDMIATTAFGIQVNSQKNPDNFLIKCFQKFFEINFLNPISSIQVTYPPVIKIMNIFGMESNFTKSLRHVSKFAKTVLEDRVENKMVRQDFLQLLLDAKLENIDKIDDDMKHELETLTFENLHEWRTKRGLTDEEIVAQMVLFLIAADLTTSSTLSFCSYIFATHPEVQQKVYEEVMEVVGNDIPTFEKLNKLPYLDMCLSEVLRMYPPSLRLQRDSKTTVNIQGWIIPKSTAVNISVYALHHDPKYWPEPYKFIPERFAPEAKEKVNPYAYLPFGIGPRMCIGIKMAKVEFMLAIASVIRKYKFVKSSKTEIPIQIGGQILMYAVNGIWMKVEQR